MKRWPYEITVTPIDEVLECVKDETWQAVRLSMKGISTEDKLDTLDWYYILNKDIGGRAIQVQTDNYLKALRRGGQLNENYEAVK